MIAAILGAATALVTGFLLAEYSSRRTVARRTTGTISAGRHDDIPDRERQDEVAELAQFLASWQRMAAATGSARTPSQLGADERPPALQGRLLVVDDNPVNQRVALRMLEKRGHVVDVADNGIEALACVAAVDYQAVLMDCQMPEMGGFEATREIRRREGIDRHTPIIAMTAGAIKGDKQKCLAAGMDDYLSKPIKAEMLAVMVDRWIAASPPADAARDPAPRPGSLLDPGILAELRELGPTEFEGLVVLFLADGAGRIAELRTAAAGGDAAAVAQLAHRLKGSSVTFGATSLALHCSQLQMLAGQGELAAAGHLLDVIAAEFAPVSAALREAVACAAAVR